jgi:hypothetical protein
METKGSLPCSQEPATGSYADPVKSSPHPYTHYFIQICFNIILQFMSWDP